MSISNTEQPAPTAHRNSVAPVSDKEIHFSQASLTCVGTACEPKHRNAVMGAFDAIMGANGMATQALGLAATVSAATTLLVGGVSPAIAGTAALTGAVASFLNPGKGSTRG